MFRFVTYGLLTAILLAWWLSANYMRSPDAHYQEDEDPAGRERPMLLKTVEIWEWEDNHETLRLYAVEAKASQKTRNTLLKEVKGVLHEQDKPTPTLIFADRAKVMGRSDLLTLTGQVRVEYDASSDLRTEELEYDKKAKVLYNNQTVTLTHTTDQVVADRLRYNSNLGRLELDNPVMTLWDK